MVKIFLKKINEKFSQRGQNGPLVNLVLRSPKGLQFPVPAKLIFE